MDTIGLCWDDSDLASLVINNVRAHGHAITYRDRNGKRRNPFRGYHTYMSSVVMDKPVFIGASPAGDTDKPALFLSFHCSHFQRWEQVLEWSKILFDGDVSTFLQGKIRRLDCCVDLAVPYETIRESVEQPRVMFVSEWKSKTRTLYLGRPPKQTCIYEKRISTDQIDNELNCALKVDRHGKLLAVRVEVSTCGPRVLIKSLNDLPKLKLLNPFAHLQFKEVDAAIVQLLTRQKRYPIEAYQHRATTVGAAMAKREFNESGNFARNIGRYLQPLEIDLFDCWKRRVDRFFAGKTEVFAEGVVNELQQ